MSDKKYTAPGFYVTRYTADRAFATSCTRTPNGSVTTYSAQEVTCVVDGTEYIFTSTTDGCSNVVNVDSKDDTWYFTSYNNVNYFVWYDGKANAIPTDAQKAILNGVGITTSGWHAATYSFTVSDLFTDSY